MGLISSFRSLSGTTIEILHILAGLVAAVAITWAAAWSYPLGQDVIWSCGAAAMVATVLMGVVAGVYYWRARTEEMHLGLDPAYRDYSEWMARHGLVPRLVAWMTRRSRG